MCLGLHRQSELTVKEPFRVILRQKAGQTMLDVLGLGGSFVPAEAEQQAETSEAGDTEEERTGGGRLI